MAYHSVIFSDSSGTYNTYSTWHLIPMTRPIIKPPETTALIEYLHDSRKSLLLSDYATNELPSYREGEFEFQFMYDDFGGSFDWATMYGGIVSALHGKKMTITLEDDPFYHYTGIVKVDWENEKVSVVRISVECEPFKYKDRVTHTINGNGTTITADTLFPTPAVLTINPRTNFGQVYFEINGLARHPITGASEAIKIKNLKSGTPVIVDGENGLVTEGNANKFIDCDFWEFPSLLPGNNILTFSSSNTTMTISYKPRYI